MSGARINLLLHIVSMTLGEFLKLAALFGVLVMPFVAGVNLLIGAMISSVVPATVYAVRYRSTECVWIFVYTVFWIVALSWISLWALFTPHYNGWLTRNLDQQPRRPSAPLAPAPAEQRLVAP